MALRPTDTQDNRPAEAVAATAASPLSASMPSFEADDDGVIDGQTRVIDPGMVEAAQEAVASANALADAADDIADAVKPQPQTSEERQLAVVAADTTAKLIEAKRQALANGVVKRDIVARALKHVIPVEELRQIQVGTFPRITVDTGGIMLDKVGELGKWIEFEVVSWAPVTLVVSGEKNDPEANKAIRSSYDGDMLDDRTHTVEEYVRYLRDVKKYKDAQAKNYVQMLVMLIATEQAPNPIPPEERRLYEVSLAPSSASQWQRAMLEAGIRAARGGTDSSLFRISHARKVNGANTYGVMTFGAVSTVNPDGTLKS